ncbi:hypothetical protein BMF94_2070 [Rhodotorula taiwanensis]|uniref:ADF-H domain-containing protein n=1 Tax=Rhodotorula taiwanensis TaxID=741276 RepID=A0A2S5BDF4_9BASI|nr:hypothetical protein BMF94_2070 [Rhodotorula taiwanensis]
MADVSNPEIKEAYEKVRNDKDDTAWLLLDYASDKSDVLSLTETGTGASLPIPPPRSALLSLTNSGECTQGLDELKTKFQDGRASFAYIRVKYSNDAESVREKFVLITWIGPDVRVMRKAKLSVHATDVKKVLAAYSIDVAASSQEDLAEEPIVKRLRQAGGASYDRA